MTAAARADDGDGPPPSSGWLPPLSVETRNELAPILALLKRDFDSHLVSAVMSTPKAGRAMTELAGPDRAWLVAGLTAAGVTAQDIADRLRCSLRLVRSIRADPVTQLCECILRADQVASDQARSEWVDHMATRAELRRVRTEMARLQVQLDQLVAESTSGRLTTFPKCRHPKTKYNVYSHGGRDHCRQCRRENKARARKLMYGNDVPSDVVSCDPGNSVKEPARS
ncbi:hypothetical protein [Mycobacterium yunnanensis]|uniref:hypothetical protein n=1 Tax=Mycobacterium yunnanensis TaxID=368477 RepID=UPI0021F32E9E|nr:hypothetical protein [Mycobacterium yunnanensis]